MILIFDSVVHVCIKHVHDVTNVSPTDGENGSRSRIYVFLLTFLWCWFLRILHLCLDTGIFTCLTPGYYAVSFSAYSSLGPPSLLDNPLGPNYLYLFKNNEQVPESGWELFRNDALSAYIGLTASRNLVSHFFGRFSWMLNFHCCHFTRCSTWMQETIWIWEWQKETG